jgi:SOS response regulatory protein OraA/RecX
MLHALKMLGLDQRTAQSWLKQSDPPVPQAALQTLQEMGVDSEWIRFAVAQAQRTDPQLASPEGAGPDTEQVAQMMGGPNGS